jgi:3-hydroxyisobutyrate dehydrogenase-like beta-hydroxyacid dehydrogenase
MKHNDAERSREGTTINVGMIGLGTMGSAVADNMRRAGLVLTVFDIRPEACARFAEKGAIVAASPAETLDRSDVVATMVFGPKEIERVLRGPNGLLSSSSHAKFWIDLTTSSPNLMVELAAHFRERGGRSVSAPVTGSVDSAIRGDMLMFVGGEDADVEAVRPVLDAIGEIRRVGAYANGYVAKLTNNQLWLVQAAAVGEAMVAAKRAGLAPDVWWRAMRGGAADSFVLRHDVPSIFAGHYDPSFPIALCLKDLALISELMAQTGVPNALTRAARRRFEEARDLYGAGAGEMTVCKVIEDAVRVSLRVEGDWAKPWEAKHPSEPP